MKLGSIATLVRLVLLLTVAVSASGGCGAESLEAGKPAVSAVRAKEFRTRAKKLFFLLTHNAYETDSSRSVFLAGPEVLRGRSYNRSGTYIWLSADAVERLIDHLHADGFLTRAFDANETAKTAPGWPSYTLTVGAAGGPRYRADLGWDEGTAAYVDGLAKALEEDSPKAVAALKAISAGMKQRLAGTAEPDGGVPDELARNLDSFCLHLQLVLDPAKVRKYKSLILSVPAFSMRLNWDPNFYVSARITKDDASRILQYLAAKGFFTRCGTVRPCERKILPHPQGPACVLNIGSSQWGMSEENLGWCPETLRRLEALGAELRGDAAQAMDVLVNRIAEDHPGWKNARATQPASKPSGEDLPTTTQKTQEPDATNQKADANALLAKVRGVLPEGWEATLYWSSEDIEKVPAQHPADWLDDRWRRWLPGMDGRRVEVRRKEVVRYQVDAPGPDPDQSYVRNEQECLRFALTLGSAQQEEDIRKRLRELNKMIEELEVVLKPSFHRREKDGYIRHTVPRDDKGRRALLEYDKLWAMKRWFPQWAEGSISVGFRSLIWLRMLPEGAKTEYRQVKEKVLNTLRPIQGWQYISADEE